MAAGVLNYIQLSACIFVVFILSHDFIWVALSSKTKPAYELFKFVAFQRVKCVLDGDEQWIIENVDHALNVNKCLKKMKLFTCNYWYCNRYYTSEEWHPSFLSFTEVSISLRCTISLSIRKWFWIITLNQQRLFSELSC